MVIRRRLRAILYPVLLYCLSGAIVSYFVWHTINGERGLKAKDYYAREIATLGRELGHLKTERRHLQRDVNLLRGKSIDRDLLVEEAEAQLGWVGKNDLVVIFPHHRR